jgi:flagellar biosynthesis protein FlhA
VIAAEDEIWPEDLLALDSGDILSAVPGRRVKDPTFGLDAVWIAPENRAEAVVAGYTVVDPATVVATHLNQIVQSAAADMFGMDEAQKLLDALKESSPQLVQGLTPNPLPLASIAALCRALLSEGVPLKTSAASPKRWSTPPARRPIPSSSSKASASGSAVSSSRRSRRPACRCRC